MRVVTTGCVLGMLCVAGFVSSASGQSYNVRKSITWDIKGKEKVPAYFWGFRSAFAQDAHNQDVIRDGARRGVRTPSLATQVDDPDKFRSTVSRANFNIAAGSFRPNQITEVTDLYKKNDTTFGPVHPEATAGALVQVAPMRTVGKKILMDATLGVSGNARIVTPLGDLNKETAYAEAYSYSKIRLRGTITQAKWNDPNNPDEGKRTGNVPIGKGRDAGTIELTGGTSAGDTGKPKRKRDKVDFSARFEDPVVLSYYDMGAGVELGRETLFQDLWEVNGDASIYWDETDGFVITADNIAGSAEYSFETPSDWVTNQASGSVSLDEGVFEVTGALSGLNWDVSEIDGVMTARLPASAFSPSFDLQYDVRSLPDSTGDVLTTLLSDGVGYAAAYATVPAPGAGLALVMAGGLCGMHRRR